jgi:arginyl-tRNA synthetase
MFEAEQGALETQIREYCASNGIPLGEVRWLPIPFSGEWGISTSFFAAAAAEAKTGNPSHPLPSSSEKIGGARGGSVPQRAQEIADAARSALGLPAGFSRVEAVNGYLNLYFSTAEYARRVVDEAVEEGADFGAGGAKGQQLMVEFSHPNTHKAFHVGHLRGTILGDALCRILEFAGHEVIRANYPGDMGLHVIRWLWGYLKYHNGEEPEADITNWMGKVYADAIRRLEENPDLEAEVRAVYARWDRRDPEIVALWQRTRQWSLDGFNQMYEALDIRFDTYYFNSQEEEVGKEIVEELISSGIAIDERAQGGAVLVKIDEILGLRKEMYRTAVILRSDGTALYATEDLALTLHKFRDHPDLARSIYVVDVRQSLHFTQVFKILEIARFEEAKKSLHVSYELVTLPGNVVMSSREGTVVLLEDLIREAILRAYGVVKEKNPALTEEQMQSVAKAVGLGALKYPMLARENTRLVTFDWESALDFSGQAAPYVQYAQVRCNSILRKAGVDGGKAGSKLAAEGVSFAYELHTAEVELIELISRFPSEVQRAAAEYKPLIIANLAYEIAKAFTSFYDQCPVIQADPPLRDARLRLVTAARNTMVNALRLLGIEAPEVM